MEIILEKVSCEISGFDCGNSTINDAINKSFWPNTAKQIEVRKICIDGDIIGYYIYTLGSISADSLPDADPLKCDFSSYCNKYAAFIIKFLAIEKPYQHKKLGTSILPYLIKFFTARCANFPVRYITIEALPECVAWYERIGFTQTTRANSDKNILMYYDAIEKSRVDLLMEHFLDN